MVFVIVHYNFPHRHNRLDMLLFSAWFLLLSIIILHAFLNILFSPNIGHIAILKMHAVHMLFLRAF